MRQIFFSFIFLILIFPGTSSANARFLDIQEVTSPGGITAWLVVDKSVPVVAMEFAFKGAGAVLDPPDKQGLARMVSNTLDEGAGEMDSLEFQEALREDSITLQFNSSRDSFFGSLKTLKENQDKAFSLLNLALTSPRFDPEPVERMRQANLARIRKSLSSPDWLAARLINDAAFAGHPYSLNSGGTLSSLQKITEEDLRAFTSRHLTKDRLLVSVTGDISPAELASLLDKVFGGLPDTSPPAGVTDTEIKGGGQIILLKREMPQTVIEIMQPGIARNNPDYYPAMLMNFILGSSGFGSRLMDEVREKKGLTYGIYTSLYNLDHANALTLSTSTENPRAGEVMDIIRTQWNKMRSEPVSYQELATAKAYLIGSMPLMLSSTDKIASLVLSLRLDDLPIDYLDRREKMLKSITREDVLNVAKKLLVSDRLTVVMIGQPQGIKPTRTVETLPNVE